MVNPLLKLNIRLVALATILLLAACGQKGPLYLPGNPSEMKTEVPKPATASEQKIDEDKDDEKEPDDHPE